MQYYLVALIISLFFAYMYSKSERNKIIYFILSILPFVLISGLRYDVGTDYSYRYLAEFYEISNGGNPKNLEIGFKIIIYLVLLFTDNPQYLFLITSLIIVGMIYFYIFKYAKYPWIGILVFFFGGFFFNSMNILRQYLAIVLLICAFHSLLKDKILLWLVFIFLAMLQHTTAIIFLVSYIPYYCKYDIKKVAKILLLCLIIGIAGKPILFWIVSLTRFKVYLSGDFIMYVQGDFQIVQTFINCIILAIYLYAYYKVPKIQKDYYLKMYISMQMLACVFSFYTAFVFLSARFVVFFSIYSIYGIARLYEYFKDKQILLRITVVLVLIYISSFSYLYLKNNVDEALPYQYHFLYSISNIKE